jgi:hypothetical protein
MRSILFFLLLTPAPAQLFTEFTLTGATVGQFYRYGVKVCNRTDTPLDYSGAWLMAEAIKANINLLLPTELQEAADAASKVSLQRRALQIGEWVGYAVAATSYVKPASNEEQVINERWLRGATIGEAIMSRFLQQAIKVEPFKLPANLAPAGTITISKGDCRDWSVFGIPRR